MYTVCSVPLVHSTCAIQAVITPSDECLDYRQIVLYSYITCVRSAYIGYLNRHAHSTQDMHVLTYSSWGSTNLRWE